MGKKMCHLSSRVSLIEPHGSIYHGTVKKKNAEQCLRLPGLSSIAKTNGTIRTLEKGEAGSVAAKTGHRGRGGARHIYLCTSEVLSHLPQVPIPPSSAGLYCNSILCNTITQS